jgi:nitroreductase
MEFFEVLKKRHSIRKFKPGSIPDDKLRKIFEAINSAPSAGNLQAYEVFVVEDRELLKRLSRSAFDQEFICQASLALVFCANPSRSSWRYGSRGERLYSIQDATIACAYAQLSATALGFGSVWVGAFDTREVLRVLGSPLGLIPVAILPIGYPDEEPEITGRRELDDLIHRVG